MDKFHTTLLSLGGGGDKHTVSTIAENVTEFEEFAPRNGKCDIRLDGKKFQQFPR